MSPGRPPSEMPHHCPSTPLQVVRVLKNTHKKSRLSPTAVAWCTVYTSRNVCLLSFQLFYIELDNSPMQNTTHLDRQASYQSQFPRLPTFTRFGSVKSTDRLITRALWSYEHKAPQLEIKSRLPGDCVRLYTQLANLTYRDDHTGANALAPRWQISRFVSCPPPVVIAHRATRGRPLLSGIPTERDDQGFVLGWTFICWAASASEQLATLAFAGWVLMSEAIVHYPQSHFHHLMTVLILQLATGL